MYCLEKAGQKYRNDPWKRPYPDRIAQLKDAKRYGRKTAAFLYPQFDSSTFRYRGYNMAETLEYSLWWSGAYFESGELEKLYQARRCQRSSKIVLYTKKSPKYSRIQKATNGFEPMIRELQSHALPLG